MRKSDELKSMAIANGLCEQWQKEWGRPDDEELIRKYIKGLDFCIKNHYPPKDYVVKHFDRHFLHEHGIWCDEEVRYTKTRMVLRGSCTGTITFGKMDTAFVWVTEDSDVTIVCNKFSQVYISVYDSAKVRVVGDSVAKVRVNAYGEQVSVNCEGEVDFRQKENVFNKIN